MKTLRFLLQVSFLLFFVSLAFGGTTNILRTGQKTCYDSSGNTISCSGTGQDGLWRAGVSWPSPRFIDNNNGTITDRLTGLMWLKDANCINTNYPGFDTDGTSGDGMVNWITALEFVKGINNSTYSNCGAGYSDWRLPNKNELKSLLDYSKTLPSLPPNNPFVNVNHDYWSSTSNEMSPSFAYYISLYYGNLAYDNKFANKYVLPVRSGQINNPDPNYPANIPKTGQTKCYDLSGTEINCTNTGQDGEIKAGVSWPTTRFVDNGNGTITDNLTGLIWLKNANCYGTNNWSNAINYANNLRDGYCGLTDGSQAGEWRLPNINEISSLINTGMTNSASWLNSQGFTNVNSFGYWTSTTTNGFENNAWAVIIWSGVTPYYDKSNSTTNYVWAVKGGQANIYYDFVVSKTGMGSGNINVTGCDLTWSNNTGICSADHGSQLTVTAVPNITSEFTHWSYKTGSAISCINNPCTFNITAYSYLYANFELKTIPITINAINGYITSGLYPVVTYGETTLVRGIANTGYYFKSISGCNGVPQTNNNQNIIDFVYETGPITEGCEINVIFEPIECKQPPSGMVLWLRGDNNPKDSVSNNHANLVNGATFENGKVKQAFSFISFNNYIEVPNQSIGDFGSNPFTIEFWILHRTYNANSQYIMGKSHPDAGLGWDIRLNNGKLRLSGINGWPYVYNWESNTTLDPNTWYHIAISASTNLIYVYINGNLEGITTRSNISSTTNPFRVGFTTNFGGNSFFGAIDEIVIYDRTLSQQEIQDIYNAGSGGRCIVCTPSPSGIISWWRGEGNGYDSVGFG
ncbi:MAG: DUF1566 domain-containing protein, partial [Proteobacteria bacterium]|nr:DUF1566 domain-containing protein [Pseudomonadota bacterium]